MFVALSGDVFVVSFDFADIRAGCTLETFARFSKCIPKEWLTDAHGHNPQFDLIWIRFYYDWKWTSGMPRLLWLSAALIKIWRLNIYPSLNCFFSVGQKREYKMRLLSALKSANLLNWQRCSFVWCAAFALFYVDFCISFEIVLTFFGGVYCLFYEAVSWLFVCVNELKIRASKGQPAKRQTRTIAAKQVFWYVFSPTPPQIVKDCIYFGFWKPVINCGMNHHKMRDAIAKEQPNEMQDADKIIAQAKPLSGNLWDRCFWFYSYYYMADALAPNSD